MSTIFGLSGNNAESQGYNALRSSSSFNPENINQPFKTQNEVLNQTLAALNQIGENSGFTWDKFQPTQDTVYFDIENYGEIKTGGFAVDRAMAELGALDYRGGMFEDNQYNQKITAALTLGGRGLKENEKDRYKDTILEFGEDEVKLLRWYAEKSKWNLAKLDDALENETDIIGEDLWDIPILRNLNNDPDAIFERKVAGFDGITALDVLAGANPEAYQMYERYLGELGQASVVIKSGREVMEEVVKEANNPYHFFYLLSNKLHEYSLQKTLALWNENASWQEAAYRYVKQFIVEGIVNDPDMEVSTEISLALAGLGAAVGSVVGPGGTVVGGVTAGGISGGLAVAFNLIKGGGKAISYSKRAIAWQRRMLKVQKFILNAQRYLPENIGPTLLLRNVDPKKLTRLQRIGYHAAGHALEGLVTGTAAEVGNQYRKSKIGDDFSVSSVISEGLTEALVTPIVNPVIGGAFRGLGYAGYGAGSVGNWMLDVGFRTQINKNSFGPLMQFIDKNLAFLDPDKMLARLDAVELMGEINSSLNELIIDSSSIDLSLENDDVSDPMGMLTVLMGSMQQELGIDNTQFLTLFKNTLNTFVDELNDPTHAREKVDLQTLMAEIGRDLIEQNRAELTSKGVDANRVLTRILAWQNHHLNIAEKAKAEGLSHSEFLKKIVDEKREFELLPEDVQLATRLKMDQGLKPGEKSKFESASLEEKLTVAKEIVNDTIKKQQDVIGAFEKATKDLEAAAEEAEAAAEEIKGPEPVDVIEEETTIPETPENIADDYDEVPGKTRREDIISRRNASIRRADKAKQNILALIAQLKDRLETGKLSKAERKRIKAKIKSLEEAGKRLGELQANIEREKAAFLANAGIGDATFKTLFDSLLSLEDEAEKLAQALLEDFVDPSQGFILGLNSIKAIHQGRAAIANNWMKLSAKEKAVIEALAEGKPIPASLKIKVKDLDANTIDALRDLYKALEKVDSAKSVTNFLQRVINEYDGVVTDKESKQPTISYAQVQGLLNDKLRNIIEKNNEKMQKTAAWKNRSKILVELDAVFKKYKAVMSNIYRAETLKEIVNLQTIQLQQTGAALQKRQRRILEAGRNVWNKMVLDLQKSKATEVRVGDVAKLLHPYSEWRQDKIEAEEQNPEVMDEMISLEEAKKIFDRETDLSLNKIKMLSVGKLQTIRFQGKFKYVSGNYEHQYADNDILGTSYDPEYVLSRSNYGTPLGLQSTKLTPEQESAEFERLDGVAKANGFTSYTHAVNAYNLYVLNAFEEATWDERVTGIDDSQIILAARQRDSIPAEEKEKRKKLAASTRATDRVKKRKKDTVTLPDRDAAPVVFTRSLDKDVEAWSQFEANITVITAHENATGTIPAWRLMAAMPDYLKWQLGVGPFAVFGRGNILGPSAMALVETTVVDVHKANVAELERNQAQLHYDPLKVLGIIRAWKERGLAQLEGWERATLDEVLIQMAESAYNEGDPNSAHNLYTAVQFVEQFQESTRRVNTILFTDRQSKGGGFILEVDPNTGYPTKFTDNASIWKDKVSSYIAERLAYLFDQRDFTSINHILNAFKIEVDASREVGKTKQLILDAIQERLHEISPDIRMEKFGNGELDYASAETTGYGLVDFLSGKEMPNTQPLHSVMYENGTAVPINADELNFDGGSPVQLKLPQKGGLNMAMPLPISQIAGLVSNFKARERMRYILNQETFTPEQRQAFEDWRKANWKDLLEASDQDPTGEVAPLFVFPQIVGGSLHSALLKRSEAKRIALELMLDVPRIAAGYIHDQITTKQGFPLMFREGPERPDTIQYWDGNKVVEKQITDLPADDNGLLLPINHGDHILVPLGRIGEVMAIEQMGPTLEGLTSTAIQAVINFQAARRADPSWSPEQSFDPRNWSDRSASGEAQMKILSLLADPDAETTVIINGRKQKTTASKLMKKILSSVFEDGDPVSSKKKESDFYINSGVVIAETFYNKNPDSPLSEVFKVFSDLKIKDSKDFADALANPEISDDLKNKLKAAREIFKVPLMRNLYGGGRPSFDLEFSRGNKGYEALQAALGTEPTPEIINDFRKILFGQITSAHMSLLEHAVGLSEEAKSLAIGYLSINQNGDLPLYRSWRTLLGLDKNEIASKLGTMETRLELLDSQMRQLAIYDGVDVTNSIAYDAWKQKYNLDERMRKAREIMEKALESGETITPGSAADKEIIKALVSTDKLAAESIGYFRALNILNSQEYRINKNRIQLVAEGLGFLDFDIDDFLGFENHALYQMMLPTATSGRTHNARSWNGLDPMGISLERVARAEPYVRDGVTYSDFFAYVEMRRSEKAVSERGAYTESDFRKDLDAYLREDKDRADSMGVYDLEDPFLRRFENREDAEAALEDLLLKQEMLQWASYDKPPKSVFPDYTVEDDPKAMLDTLLIEWHRHTEQRHMTLNEEIAYEEQLFADGGVNNPILKLRSKALGLVNRRIVEASKGALLYRPYFNSEVNDSTVLISNSNVRGPLAMRPKYKTVSYYNMGLPSLQFIHLQKQLDAKLGPVVTVGEATKLTPEEAMVGGDNIGHHPAWKNEDLPDVLPTIHSKFDIDTTVPSGMRAAKLFQEIHTWAGERGLERRLDEDLENYARFYLIMEIEKVRKQRMRINPRDVKTLSDQISQRNIWLADLHNIISYSRDIKTPDARKGFALAADGEPLAIANPVSEEATLINLLDDIADENNPEGVLLRESLLSEALDFGLVPTENLIMRDGFTAVDETGNDISDAFDFKDLSPQAWAIQNTDFNIFLAATIMTEAFGNVLMTYKDGKYKDIAMFPERWEEVDAEDRLEIKSAAFKFARSRPSFVLEVGLEEKIYEASTKKGEGKKLQAYKATIRTPESVSEDTGAKGLPIKTIQRNAWGGIGFGMMIMAKSKIKSKGATITISAQRSQMLVGILENQMTMQDLTLSSWLNKGLNIKVVDGKLIRTMPLQQKIHEATGYTARGIREAHLISSESLLRLNPNLTRVTDPTVSVEGRQVSVVDLHKYWTDSKYSDNASRFAWIESYVSPVLKTIRMLDNASARSNTTVNNLKLQLENLVKEARAGNKTALLRLQLLTLKLENPKINTIDNKVIRQFIDRNQYNESDFHAAAIQVEDLVADLSYYVSEDGYVRDNVFYRLARSYWMEDRETSTLDDFRTWLEEHPEKPLKTWGDFAKSGRLERDISDGFYMAMSNEMYATERGMADLSAAFGGADPGTVTIPPDTLKALAISGGVEADYDDVTGIWGSLFGKSAIDLTNVLKDIDRLVTMGVIKNTTQRTAIRTIVIKAYQFNPDIIKNLRLESIASVVGGAEAERSGNNFVIRFGDEVRNVITDDISIIKIFAHELAHIARLKFIKDFGPEFREYQSLHNSDNGRKMLKKLIMAWNNGVWTKDAQNEYDKYVSDPEEFIAGLASYYLMSETRSVVNNFTSGEGKLFAKAHGIMIKMMSYLANIFQSLEGAFITGNQKLDEDVQRLVQRTFGYDNTRVVAQLKQLDSSAISDNKLGWDYRFGEATDTQENATEDARIDRLIKDVELYNRSIDLGAGLHGMSLDETKVKRDELELELNQEKSAGEQYFLNGMTRAKYRELLPQVIQKYPAQKRDINIEESAIIEEMEGGIIDLEKLIESNASDDEKAVAFIYLQKALMRVYGDPVTDGLGEVSNKVLGLFPQSVRDFMIGGLVGSTGQNSTWNSRFLLPILLTQLLDDSIVNASGNYTSLRGTPSVQRMITEISTFTTQLKRTTKQINSTISPLFTAITEGRISGSKVNVFRDIQKQAMYLIENPEHVIDLSSPNLAALNDKQKTELTKLIQELATVYREMTKRYISDGQAIGDFGSGFANHIAYQFNNTINLEPTRRSTLHSKLEDKVLTELLNQADKSGKLNPVMLYQHRLLPSIDSENKFKEDLMNIKKNHPEFYHVLLKFIIDPEETMDPVQVTSRANELDAKVGLTADIEINYGELRANLITLIRKLNNGRLSLDSFGMSRTESIRFLHEYKDLIKNRSTDSGVRSNLQNRLNDLLRDDMPAGIYFKGTTNTISLAEKSGWDGIDFIVTNWINRASIESYYPNDNFAIPRVTKVLDDIEISEHLVLDISILAETAKKGVLNRITEKKMLRQFGVHGTFNSVISLSRSMLQASNINILTPEGSPVTAEQTRILNRSLDVLQEKHDAILGIDKRENFSTGAKLLPYASAITKVAYGNNLLLANLTYETVFNSLDELLGRGSIAGFLRGALSPINAITNKKERQEALSDLAYLVESLSQGYVPEFAMPANYGKKGVILRGLEGLGNAQMRAAKFQLKNVAAARAITVRGWITRNIRNGKLIELSRLIETRPPTTPAELKGLIRESGISVYANQNIVQYLLKAGLLKPAKLEMLLAMMPENGRYSPFEMSSTLFKEGRSVDTEGDFNKKLDIIAGLKSVEASFVEEVILAPNVFDLPTNPESKSGFNALFEIYRRHQTLFAAAQVIRRSSRFSVSRAALRLVTSVLLDSLYMTILYMASGASFEDIMEDYKKNPGTAFLKLTSRTALMGRYFALVAPVITNLATKLYHGAPLSKQDVPGFGPKFIPAEATKGVIGNIYELFADDKNTDQEIIMLMRLIPVIGDGLVRLFIFQAFPDLDKKDYQSVTGLRQSQSRESLRQPVQQKPSRTIPMPRVPVNTNTNDDFNTPWEANANIKILEEIGITAPPQIVAQKIDRNNFMNSINEYMPKPEPTPQPAAPPDISQPQVAQVDPVESLLDQKPTKAPDALIKREMA